MAIRPSKVTALVAVRANDAALVAALPTIPLRFLSTASVGSPLPDGGRFINERFPLGRRSRSRPPSPPRNRRSHSSGNGRRSSSRCYCSRTRPSPSRRHPSYPTATGPTLAAPISCDNPRYWTLFDFREKFPPSTRCSPLIRCRHCIRSQFG